MRLSLVFIIFLSLIAQLGSTTSPHTINKRYIYLLFPKNTVLQFTYGLTIPFVLPRRSINLTWAFQAQYNLPYDLDNFTPTTVDVRSQGLSFDLPKIRFYEYLAKLLNNFGLHGEYCVLRSVCEIAEVPMFDKEDTVLEKIVQFLFTPSLDLKLNETRKDLLDDNLGLDAKLLLAEKHGKTVGNCEEKYSKCIISLVDLMTVLYVT